MRRSLKATTAILASLNLALPLPALAQSQEQPAEAAPDCSATPDDPACATAAPDPSSEPASETEAPGTEQEATEDAAPAEAPAEEPAVAGAEADAEAGEGSDAPAEAVPAPEADTPATEEEAPATDGAAAAPEETQPAPDEDAPAEAIPPSEEAAPTDEPVSAEDPAAETQPEATAPSDGEASTDTEADGAATNGDASATETETETETEGGAGAEMPSAESLEQSLQQDSDAQSGEAGADAEGDAPAPESAAETGADAEVGAEGEATPRGEQSSGTDTQTDAEAPETSSETDGEMSSETETETETDASTEAGGDQDIAPEGSEASASEEAAIEGEAPRAAAAAEDAEPVETDTTTVTEDDARTSSEDFQSAIDRSEDPGAQNEVAASDDGDSGLSTLEKGLLLGAGALAVGAVLNNNRRVVASADDRVVVSRGEGNYELIKDDNAILARPGSQVETQTFDDGSSRTVVTYDDGSQVVTIRDADLRVLRRERVTPNGESILLVDDLDRTVQPVDVQTLRASERPSRTVDLSDEAALREALSYDQGFDRAYSLGQVRSIQEVRAQVPAVDLEAITFDTGSAAIRPEQAEELRGLGSYIRETIAENPRAVFLVEGHTDAVGDAATNLALSDRRAESVALALGEYFEVPTSNLVVQGYGERFPKVDTQDAERANRRATVRNITPLLQTAAAN